MVGWGAALLALDQASKAVVRRKLRGGSISIGGLLRIRLVANPRPARRFPGGSLALVAIWCAALAAAVALYHAGSWFHGRLGLVGLGLAFGGAAGNMLDLLRWRSVTDFIDLGWWPVFNIADVAIVGGLAAALWPGG